MKRALKWIGAVVLVTAAAGFLAFLYFIPPFTTMKPEEFIQPEADAAPRVEAIADPNLRAFAEHGREIVMHTGCIRCHLTPGPRGPQWDKYLGGGLKFITRANGMVVSGNLTPDPETGIGKRTDEEILRVLRAGVSHTGRVINHRTMPWPELSRWTEEDRRAVLAYLRHLKPVQHAIPDPDRSQRPGDAKAEEAGYSGADYGRK